MNLLRPLFDGFTEGVLAAAAYQQVYGNAGCDPGRIQRCLRQLGWSVDERGEGDVIFLYFKGTAGTRRVRIAGGDGCLVNFSAYSSAAVPAGSVPAEVMGYLLRRNISGDSGIGMWGVFVNERERATFHVTYDALGAGLDADALKYICQSLAAEAEDFDGKLRQAGLLR